MGQVVLAQEATPAAATLGTRSGSLKIFAVTGEGQGLSADLTLEIAPGTGKIWTSIHPLVGTTTQTAEKTALIAAKKYASNWEQFDYKFAIDSSASMVEGPSAGAAMAYLTVALLEDKSIPKDVSITGTISEDGIVGTVGGVFEKAKAARDAGMRLFMIPAGEARRIEKLESGVESINLMQYARDKWGLYVIEVSTIEDVMKYAYADLAKIDLQSLIEEEPPQFVPKKLTPVDELLPMKEITKKHLREAKQLLGEARNALSSTLIDDISIIGRMVGSLNIAEKNIKTAEILFDQGYFYSSANFAFLARVNALLIKDIAENPALLTTDSTVFELKIDLLKQEIIDLKKQMSEFMPVDKLEWMVSAQQRLGWAEVTLNDLSGGQTVVVSSGAAPTSRKDAVIDSLYKFESARAWLVVAREFFIAAQASERKVKPISDFTERVQELLVKAENGLTVLKGDDIDDIERRIDSAKEELKRGWTLAALYNASSALALIEGRQLVERTQEGKLEENLRSRLDSLAQGIKKSKYKHVWANLYLDHARYYLEQAVYYRDLNHKSDAVESFKNGLSLAVLAESLFSASEEVNGFYEQNVTQPVGEPEKPVPAAVKEDQAKWYVLFFLLPTVLFIVLLVMLLKLLKARKSDPKYSVYEELKEVKQRQRELEENLAKGKLSQDDFLSESGRLSERMRQLLRMREAKTESTFASDKFRADLLLFDMKARDLRRGLKQGVLSPDDFARLVNDYNEQIKQLYDALAEEQAVRRSTKAVLSSDEDDGGDEDDDDDAGSDLAEVQRSVRKQFKTPAKKRLVSAKK